MKKQQSYNNLPDDATIRQRMENLQIPFDEQGWSMLRNSLDNIAQQEDFEAGVKSSLEEITFPYDAASWAVLARKMEVSTFKRFFTAGKALELLFLFLFIWWYPIKNDNLKPELRRAITDPQAVSDVSKLNNPAVTTDHKDLASQSDFVVKKIDPEKDINNSKYTLLGNHLSALSDRHQPERMVSSDHFTGNSTYDVSHSYVSEKMVLAQVETNFPGQLEFLPRLPISTQVSQSRGFVMPVFQTPDDYIAGEKQLAQALERVNSGRKARIWLGVAVAADRDLIRSPHPTQLSVNHMGRIEQNFHTQLSVFLEYNFLEFQTGLIWQKKEYRSVYEGINDARIIGIPLNVRLKFNQAGIMRGYVMGGITAHFAAYANYQETELFMRDPTLFYVNNNYRKRESGLLPSSRYRNGILEGESLYGNQYYTANIAVGMEIYLHKSYRLFLEQAYFHNLDYGIGPAFDKFSTASTTFGFRYLLK